MNSLSRGLILAALLASPATAAEYMHCYLRDAPADAKISSEYNVSGMLDAVPIAYIKHACGVDTADDRALLDRIVAAGQCSPESEIAGFARETFVEPPEEVAAGLVEESSEAIFSELCSAIDLCAPGESGYDDACNAAVDAAMGG